MTMKIKKFVCAIAAASLAMSGMAFAQGNPGSGEQPLMGQRGGSSHGGAQRSERPSMPAQPAMNRGRPVAAHEDRGEGRGAGPDHAFYRGGRLPPEYRGRHYVVDDWRGHHLSAPPRGYQWVQTGGDYVLVAIATGLIASILLNGGH
jgi:Ni/Co efflux regulator RcnB